jgi:predicted alpha/beta superfamily hydrolase
MTHHTPHTLTGDIRLHRAFHSEFLAKDRDVIVYLPPGYEADRRRRFPVLYLHDGQNLFDGATAYIPGREWGADETAQALIRAGEVEPLIIVGVYNAGAERINEYTPTRDARVKAGGRADLYGRMLVEELKPFIDREYRTLTRAHHTGLGGSSLGGLVTLHLGLKYPAVFGQLAVMSPAVWWDGGQIVREVNALARKPPLRIWLDIGLKEGPSAAANARRLRDALIGKGWRPGRDLRYFEARGGGHDEAAWGRRFGSVLRYLFPPRAGRVSSAL